VADSITWRWFCRIPLDGSVPHPTTLMKLTTRCGSAAVDGLNEALLAKAAEAKLLRTSRIRVDTTAVAANVAYPTDSGLLATAVRRIAATGKRIQPRAVRPAPGGIVGHAAPAARTLSRPSGCLAQQVLHPVPDALLAGESTFKCPRTSPNSTACRAGWAAYTPGLCVIFHIPHQPGNGTGAPIGPRPAQAAPATPDPRPPTR